MSDFDFMKLTDYEDFQPKESEVEEYIGSLKRAFTNNESNSIVLDSNPRGNRFLYRATRWGIYQGIIEQESAVDESQSMIWEFCLASGGLEKLSGKVFRDLSQK